MSDHNLIQVKLEATLIERGQPPQEDLGEVDLRTLPQSAIRKVIQECVKQGLFEEAPDIHKQPLLSQVPTDIIELFRPQAKKGHQTVRYSPAQKTHETPELLQLAGELHNHKVLDELHRHFRANNMKAFYATAEKVLRVQCGNPVVKSVIVEEQLLSDRDQVDEAIAKYFQ